MGPVAVSLAALLTVAYVSHCTQHSLRVSRAQAAGILSLVKCVCEKERERERDR